MSFTIDYTCSDLTEEEIAAHIAQMKAERLKERQQEAECMKKARAFHFVGGLC